MSDYQPASRVSIVWQTQDPFEMTLAKALGSLRRGRSKEFFMRLARAHLPAHTDYKMMARIIEDICNYTPRADALFGFGDVGVNASSLPASAAQVSQAPVKEPAQPTRSDKQPVLVDHLMA